MFMSCYVVVYIELSCQCHVMLVCTQDTDSLNCLAKLSSSCHVVVHAALSCQCHVMLVCTQDTDSQNCLAELSVSVQVEAKSDTTQPLQFKVHAYTFSLSVALYLSSAS